MFKDRQSENEPEQGNGQGFFTKKLEDMSNFCGATDTPVLDFWWCLFWVSKPAWAALFTLGRGVHVTHFLRFTSCVTPADLFVESMVA